MTHKLYKRITAGIAKATRGEEMDRFIQSIIDQLNELEQTSDTDLSESLELLQKNKENIKVNLELYYNEKTDTEDKKHYYRRITKGNPNRNLFFVYHELMKKTHKKRLPYFISKDEYLYTWVDLQPDGSIKNIYSGIHQDPRTLIQEDFETIQKRHHEFRRVLANQNDLKKKQIKYLPQFDFDFKFNTEHIVPQSWFSAKEPMKGDLHHLFACQPDCNIKRGNFPYDDFSFYTPESPMEQIQNQCGVTVEGRFEPEYGKGTVARAMLYFLVRYPRAIQNSFLRKIDIPLLIQWHKQFNVTLYEKHRNQAIYLIQGNRNPFIDYPELVEQLEFPLLQLHK